jgi:two-component system cell cycle sensor histidine kinase/response regulator CckA
MPIDKSKVKILIIEDEKLLREYVADYLEDIGYCVTAASNGREGLDLFHTLKPDLVITDLRMPEVNGLEVLAAIKAEASLTPVIVVSGTGSLEDAVQTLRLGAWDYILKPIKDVIIIDISIMRALERKNLLDENRRYREHLEHEVESRTRELTRTYEKFRTLFNNAGDAIFIHDFDGRIIETNHKAAEYLNYDPAELSGMHMQQVYSPDEALLLPHYIDKATGVSSYTFESIHINHDGQEVPIEVNICLIQLEGKPAVFAGCRDISRRKQAEMERQTLENQFLQAQKMESLGLLAGGIAHDFRNILAGVDGYARLIKKRFAPGSKELDFATRILSATRKGLELTDKLTGFMRKGPQEFKKIDVCKLCTETIGLLRPSCSQVTIELETHIDSFEIAGDPAMLENALINLGLNARDAMPEGGKLTFSIEPVAIEEGKATGSPEYVRISVSDTGIGMDTELLSHMFEPLYTTKEPGKGTGLGLSSVYSTIKQHNGVIEVASTEGEGTTFTIYLPRAADQISITDTNVVPPAGLNRSRILVIDDKKMIGAPALQNLNQMGFEVDLKEKALEAIDFYQHNHGAIKLVMVSSLMPLMHGNEIIRALKAINPDVRVVFLTTDNNFAETLKNQAAEVVDIISKPFTVEQICSVVAKASPA